MHAHLQVSADGYGIPSRADLAATPQDKRFSYTDLGPGPLSSFWFEYDTYVRLRTEYSCGRKFYNVPIKPNGCRISRYF